MDGQLTHQALAKLSRLGRDKLDEFVASWRQIPDAERRRIALTLAEMAQDNVDLNYSDLFVRMLEDPAAEVRIAAIEGLWEDDRATTADRMIAMARHDPEELVRATAFDGVGRFAVRTALGETSGALADRVREVLRDHLGPDTPTFLRRRALEAAGYLDEPRFVAAIEQAHASSDVTMRAGAVKAMGRNCHDRWLPTILCEMESPEPELRFEAVRAAAETEDERFVPRLIERTEDEDREVRLAAIGGLGSVGGQRAQIALRQVIANGDEAEREAAETALDELEVATDPLGIRVREVEKN